MVDLYIGGATPEERDNRFDSTEDAVLNCRSAAESGYGYGANFEGLRASKAVKTKYENNTNETELNKTILNIILNSYLDIIALLYGSKYNQYFDSYQEYIDVNSKAINEIKLMDETGKPVDVTTGKPSDNVISSINGDISVLEIISKLMTILINCKQFICPIPTISYKSAKKDIADAPAVQIIEE